MINIAYWKLKQFKVFSAYLLVSVVNTIIGYGVIFCLMYIGTSPELSNVIGYAIGITFSYILNKIYIFKSKAHPKKEFPKFVVSLLASYGLNFLTLIFCVRVIHINPYVSQIISGAVYTVSGFYFVKVFAFKESTYILKNSKFIFLKNISLMLIILFGLWTSVHYTFCAWGPDSDQSFSAMLWFGVNHFGLSFIKSVSFTPDNWMFSLMPYTDPQKDWTRRRCRG